MARSSTTSDVFNAIAEAHRRDVLDVLDHRREGRRSDRERPRDVPASVSKRLRVLRAVGLVTCRAEGRRRLYRLERARLRPLHEWLAGYEQAWNDRLDRVDDLLKELQHKESGNDT